MKSRLAFVFLFLAGLLLLVIGGTILLAPHAFHAGNGIVLGNDPNLRSEIRAPGGLLVGSGILILIGAFRHRLRLFAVILTVLVYGSFGLARLLGLALDGMPATGIVAATVIELVMATIGLMMLRRSSAAASTEAAPQLAVSPDFR